MGPLNDVVSAIALGAAVGLKDTAAQTVKDAYSALKSIIQRRYQRVPLAQLEEEPESPSRQAVVIGELEAADALQDVELLRQAQALLDVVMREAPEASAAIGVDIDQVKAARVRIAKIESAGTGVRVSKSEIQGDIEIADVRAGTRRSYPKKV